MMDRDILGRRGFLAGAGAGLGLIALGGCASGQGGATATVGSMGPRLTLSPLRTGIADITRITVCTRPFRPQGPRIERERIGDKDVIHHYGHGGSGWSLSWGSGAVAVDLVMATGQRDIAVIGCGAIGLTTATLLQRAGMQVTIYAKEMPPEVRSSYATGVWSPDSRICMEEHATPAFKAQWASMCRRSFASFQDWLGLPADPVQWYETYSINDLPRPVRATDSRPPFAHLQRELVPELLVGQRQEFAPGQHDFGNRSVRRSSNMMFNINAYTHQLLSEFLAHGGKLQVREFHSPTDFATLPQKTLVNCTGYGARSLMRDDSLIPVRGQLARAIPQADITYGLYYNQVSFVPRRDGLVFQQVGDSDYYGYGEEGLAPDRTEAEQAVATIAGLFQNQAA
ncbi:FAD-dependent oxidoreductase [Niveispirillum irakense]|uniref:FAD-dependent oxidoreductase n=1 Tax=Niveispirillum irakense TaxID=34011 RepID=UPI000402B950|nr:FAD-dependent oxidoreductase [Niveispirillum irakense]